MTTGRLEDSVGCFERAAQLDPTDAAVQGNLGAALTELGRYDDAVASFRASLNLRPTEADTHSNLGTALARMGRLDEAAESFREALRLRPQFAEANTNLGAALAKLGRFDEAVAQYRQALELKPKHPETHNNIGSLLLRMSRPADAEGFLRKATQLNPHYAEAHNNLGLALLRQHNDRDAANCFDQAVALRPEYADARRNLGIARARLGEWRAAAGSLRLALERNPKCVVSLVWLARALTELGEFDEAQARYQRALELEPTSDADGLTDLSVVDRVGEPTATVPLTRANQVVAAILDLADTLAQQSRPDDALLELEKARKLNPNDAFIVNKMGAVLWSLRRYDEGLACFDEAIKLQPDHAEAHLNRSHYFLMHGDFATGLDEYDWRLRIKSYFPASIPERRWGGEPLDGRPIVLHNEQGLGDVLMMLRFVPLVKDRGGRVIYKCPPPLRGLLAGFPGIDELVSPESPSPPDAVHAPMMSLPRLFAARVTQMPGAAPYLTADPVLVQFWQRELSRIPGIRIGIVWQGSPRYASDRERSIPLRCFAPLAGIEGVRLISLQKGQGREQIQGLPDSLQVLDFGQWLDERGEPFVDTAAVMCGLELVIAADTSIGHLAGALGVPVWLALSSAADWRWLRDRDDTPWYPTMRLFRQRAPGDWNELFGRMADELYEFPPPRRMLDAFPIGVSPGELIDRITILGIKSRRFTAGAARGRVRVQLQAMESARQRQCPASAELDQLEAHLAVVNEQLWEVEDELRACERRREFGPRFVELARSVYKLNDQRAEWKRQIDSLFRSSLSDEKQYERYD
jgi:tetratricopeptide (TPR) repeat protein